MARVKKRITARKALETFIKYTAATGAALATVEIPDGDLSDKAMISVAIGVVFAIFRAWNNVAKTRKAGPALRGVDYSKLTLIAILGIGMAGCASNGITVSETTPDGGTLVVEQKTVSTWGSKTDEGAGDFLYTATAPDGSSFDMRAGAGVQGQQAGDPAALVLGVVNAIAPLVAQQQAQPQPQPVDDDRIERVLVLLERMAARK